MNTNKGIVCEITENYMIFLTAKGEFLRGTPMASNVQIGEEVEFQTLTVTPNIVRKRKAFIITPALITAAIIIFFFIALFPTSTNAFAYVQVGNDLQLEVDEKGTVISVNSMNAERITLSDLEGLPLDVALTKVVNEMATEEEVIPISTKFNNDQPSESKEKINNAVNVVKQKKHKELPKKNPPNVNNNRSNEKPESNTNNNSKNNPNQNSEQKQNSSNNASNDQTNPSKSEEKSKQNKPDNQNQRNNKTENHQNHTGKPKEKTNENNRNNKNNQNKNNGQHPNKQNGN